MTDWGWYRGTRLAERVRLRRSATADSSAVSQASERGRTRLAKWKAQSPFQSSALFQQRLEQGGLTETELGELLSHKVGDEVPGPGEPPDWARAIGLALSDAGTDESIPFPQTLDKRP